MKIRIDMQGVQTDSRHRGIGRYCIAITRAFAELASDRHDMQMLFNAALDGIDEAIEALADLDRKVTRRVVGPMRNVSYGNRSNDARRLAAERVFTHALDAEAADVVWLGSVVEGFTDDAIIPHVAPRAFTVATLYDLIPLHDADYISHARAREWYMHRLAALKRCDLLLAISEWVRKDAIERLGIPPERIIAIGAGVQPQFRPPEVDEDHSTYLQERFGISRPFVMYNGGFDKRKNVMALVAAYAALPREIRANYALVIVGRVDPTLREQFIKALERLTGSGADIVFPGFVDDADLVRLYQMCSLFVFPSEREGFGLAPLEAMACGAPTIVNAATSLPEVVGTLDALVDAAQPGAMTTRMLAVLTDPALADRLRRAGLARAADFSWQAVAARALTAIEARFASGKVARHPEPAVDWPIYHANADSVGDVLTRLRQWPGRVIWRGPPPATGPAHPADRFRLGGYAQIREPVPGSAWFDLLAQDAIGLDRTEDKGESCEPGENAQHVAPAHDMERQRSVEQAIADSVAANLSDDDLARIADALVRSTPAPIRRWLVDVTHISERDLGTGVHRVVRSILREWLIHPPPDIRIEPVTFRSGRFHHAHDYACRLIGAEGAESLPENIVSVTGNEAYIGLDWTLESLPSAAPLLRTWRRAGVRMHFVVHDLLPMTMPHAFHASSRTAFAAWLGEVARLADGLHCVSRSTADDLIGWLREHVPGRLPRVNSFDLGVEIEPLPDAERLDPTLLEAMARSPSLLMVGTLEPRKGHMQTLDALDLMWESGADVNLVIVGHRGWLVKELVERLERHRERGKRLFWLDDANDAVLEALYQSATALLAASHGEGYGLPLIEAAHRGKPVIARALPVFREIAGDYPSYFDTESPEALATHLTRWLVDRPRPGQHPAWKTWSEAAVSLRRAIDD